MTKTTFRLWMEIDLDHIVENYRAVLQRIPEDCQIMPVVKANAYGTNAVPIALELEKAGCGFFAVTFLEEALRLRKAGLCGDILVMAPIEREEAELAARAGVTVTLCEVEGARALSEKLSELGQSLQAHIKLDTGMSRLGFQCDEAHFDRSLEEICRVCALPGLEVEGVFTHFAVSDEDQESSRAYTQLQHQRFEAMLSRLAERGVRFSICHCANSGATVSYPQFAHDMFRPGIITYGIGDQAEALGLRPVMSLKTVIGAVKDFAPDTTISYGRTFRTGRPSRVGVLPIGYADGLHRVLSNRWRVWTEAGTAPILGRICMDMCMIDLTDLPGVGEGDVVEVYGPHNSVNEAARLAGTISYELTCAVSKRVPRIYMKNGVEVARELLLRA